MSQPDSSGPNKTGNLWLDEVLSPVKDNGGNITDVVLIHCDDGKFSLLVKNIQEKPIWQDEWSSRFNYVRKNVLHIRGYKDDLKKLFNQMTVDKSLQIFGVLSKIEHPDSISYPMMEVVWNIINMASSGKFDEKGVEKSVRDFLKTAKDLGAVWVGLDRIERMAQKDAPQLKNEETPPEKVDPTQTTDEKKHDSGSTQQVPATPEGKGGGKPVEEGQTVDPNDGAKAPEEDEDPKIVGGGTPAGASDKPDPAK